MRRFIIRAATLVAAALIAGVAALSATPTPALAHDELVNTEIVESSSDGTPESIRLTFNNTILEVGTEFVITAPDGSDASDGSAAVSGRDVTLPLADGLAAGSYQAAWRVVSSDGHPIEGAFVVKIAEDGSAEVEEGTIPEETPQAKADEDDGDHSAPGTVGPIRGVLMGVGIIAAIAMTAGILFGARRFDRAHEVEEDEDSTDDATDNTDN